MQDLQVIENNGQRVVTTKQIALAYEVAEKLIRKNYENNKERYERGKHYICLQGEELKRFLQTQNLRLQNQSKVRHLYLWTEKGALLHAKSLNTDKAWEVYDYLVDHYFRTKEEPRQQPSEDNQEIVPVTTTVEKIPDALPDKRKKDKFVMPEMNHPVMIFHTLLDLAEKQGTKVRILPFKSKSKSILHGNRIGIKEDLKFNEITYELAYELAHVMLHYDKGIMLEDPLWKYYDEQAERAAAMMIELLNIKVAKLGQEG